AALAPGQASDYWRKGVDGRLEDAVVGDAPALAPGLQVVDQLVDGAEHDEGTIEKIVDAELGPAGGQLGGGLAAIVGHDHALDERIQLEPIEARTGLGLEPGQPLVDGLGPECG